MTPVWTRGVTPPNTACDSRGHFLQDLISCVVAELVVHALETVKVEQQQSNGFVLSLPLLHRLFERIEQQCSIRQADKYVVIREMTCLCRLALKLRDLPQEARVALDERFNRVG